ncbi:MAG: hypothetical protein IPL40_09310 [Proteobacteria bacterium]|nr:hypothetical protein [Pseudomonadota bacterium]
MALRGNSRSPRERRKLLWRRLLRAALLVVVAIVLVLTALRRWTEFPAPEDERAQAEVGRLRSELTPSGVRLLVGQGWAEQRDGVWQLHLAGDPQALGRAHGQLVAPWLGALDRELARDRHEAGRGALARWWGDQRLRWQLRGLAHAVPAAQLLEMAALSAQIVETEPLPATPFQRLVSYHALPELALRREPSGAEAWRCLAAAGWRGGSVDGRVVVGYSIDPGVGRAAQRRVVLVVRPRAGLPFVALGWAGATGVPMGVNARRLLIAGCPARTDGGLQSGIPLLPLVRELLERAGSLGEALKLVQRTPRMGAGSLLVADGKTNEVAILEWSPDRVVLRTDARQLIAMVNHLQDERFEADASNDRVRRYSTSEARGRRVAELLRRGAGRFDAGFALRLLRDRAGPGGAPLAPGHPQALDALGFSAAGVVDLRELVFWTTGGPLLSGPFAAIDLKPIFGLPVQAGQLAQALPADATLGGAELLRWRLAREELVRARELARAGAWAAAAAMAERVEQIAPALPQAQILAGDALWAAGAAGAAKLQYRALLASHPPFLEDVERARARLAEN